MEVDEIQTLNKFPRRSNDEKTEDGEIKRQRNTGGSGRGRGGGGGVGDGGGATLDFTGGVGGVGRLCGWPSSRIVRVSRASGGKDRHSKVLTSKGLRDRRVRLSVNTAIQFYDLQDRLGYDQPSKAVEWLLKAADTSISDLPPISTTFPDTPKQFSDEKIVTEHGFDSEMKGGGGEGLDLAQNQQGGTLSNTACSSTSETSKGSGGGGLSLSRSESRLKARERARERAAKEKEKEKEESETAFVVQQQQKHNQNVRSIPQNATFTELLTSGFTGTSNVGNQNSNNNSPNGSGSGVHESNFFQKSPRNWSSAAMDYFGGGGMLVPSTAATRSTHGFHGQIQLGNNMQQALVTPHVSSPFFTVAGDTNQELHSHSFSLIPEHSNEYNLNFSISSTNSSGLAGFNRGTLQSNSSTPSLLAQIQRFSSSDHQNGSSPSPFFLGTTPPPNAAVENHHHHQQQQQHHFLPTGFDSGLQLFYGDGSRHADQKGKGKN